MKDVDVSKYKHWMEESGSKEKSSCEENIAKGYMNINEEKSEGAGRKNFHMIAFREGRRSHKRSSCGRGFNAFPLAPHLALGGKIISILKRCHF